MSLPRFACDAMCGGLARWLRSLGYDTTYTPDIDDRTLIRHAAEERRTLLSTDGRMFERRVLASGEVRGLLIPRGLKRLDQVRFVVRALRLRPHYPRCPKCNGELERVRPDEVADVVPARSLVFASEFFRCLACGHVYWDGTHWQRIERLRAQFEDLASGSTPAGP